MVAPPADGPRAQVLDPACDRFRGDPGLQGQQHSRQGERFAHRRVAAEDSPHEPSFALDENMAAGGEQQVTQVAHRRRRRRPNRARNAAARVSSGHSEPYLTADSTTRTLSLF